MDKAVLKKFAIESRSDLMSRMSKEIDKLYYNENFDVIKQGELYILTNDENHTLKLTEEEYNKRELLIKRINELSYEQVVEESAYTWFNRIIAIRYMEIHDYLPLTKDNRSIGIRVLSSKDNTPDPEIFKFSILNSNELDINFNLEKYNNLSEENRYAYILSLICKKLGKVIPQVFDGITDYIDMLIPDNLLNDSGFITKLIKEVPEENFNDVEVIGWLYQYYISERKDKVFDDLKKNIKIKKENIPPATQIFTPDWIVKYMIENTLPNYCNIELENLNYKLKSIENFSKNITEITMLDPCCGSGHILVSAFDMFYKIYEKMGFNKKDIVESILKNNLYGLDIDDRAGQLAILSVLLKARKYDRNLFSKNLKVNILSISESNKISQSALIELQDYCNKEIIQYIISIYRDAKEYGTLIRVRDNDYEKIISEVKNINNIFRIELQDKFIPLLEQSKILSKKYDLIITNPPYMGSKGLNNNLRDYLATNFPNGKMDTYASFIIRCTELLKENGYIAMMTPNTWLTIKSYKELRNYIINNYSLESLLELSNKAFNDANVVITSFIIKNTKIKSKTNFMMFKEYDENELKNGFLDKRKKCIFRDISVFKKMPNYIIVPELSDKFIDILITNQKLGNKIISDGQNKTGDNDKYLRMIWEVEKNKIGLNKKWSIHAKGGSYRKWYGNLDTIIDWSNEARNFYKNDKVARITPEYLWYKEGITWGLISGTYNSFRFLPEGMTFNCAGPTVFLKNKAELPLVLGSLNSKLTQFLLTQFNETINLTIDDISNLPFVDKNNDLISKIVKQNINTSKLDWDSFETSWDFKKHPLLEFITSLPGLHDTDVKVPPTHVKIIKNNYGEECFIADKMPMNAKISDAYDRWKEFCDKQFNTLKHNEEELNRIFIDIYGLQDELTPEVEDKDVTIRKADKLRDIKSFISYAVGCMFGRYSLDEEGLIYAGGEFDSSKYKTYKADEDNIIPITDQNYFKDDIVEKFKEFLKVTFGDQTLNENMDYIAKALGNKIGESSEDTIRRYFVNDFFNDHVKIYQKRPIYWLLDSGKKNGFKALIYMHRYNENLIPKARLDYLHKVQSVYEKRKLELENISNEDLSLIEKKNIQKELLDLNAKLAEIKVFDEKINHIVNQRINIDLDDGVKVNYEKFSDILAKIK